MRNIGAAFDDECHDERWWLMLVIDHSIGRLLTVHGHTMEDVGRGTPTLARNKPEMARSRNGICQGVA
jgi:hypothetical protein